MLGIVRNNCPVCGKFLCFLVYWFCQGTTYNHPKLAWLRSFQDNVFSPKSVFWFKTFYGGFCKDWNVSKTPQKKNFFFFSFLWRKYLDSMYVVFRRCYQNWWFTGYERERYEGWCLPSVPAGRQSGWWCLSLRCETKASGLVVGGSEHSSRARGHPRRGVAGSVCLDLRRGV